MLRIGYDELVQACEKYRENVLNGVRGFSLPSFEHFCGWIYESAADVKKFAMETEQKQTEQESETRKGKKRERKDAERGAEIQKAEAAREAVRRLDTFIRGQLTSNPIWGGAQNNKAMFLLKQNNTGYYLQDKQTVENAGDISIKVSFGGNISDPFG